MADLGIYARRGFCSAATPGGSAGRGPRGTGGIVSGPAGTARGYRRDAIGGTSNAITNPTSIVGTPTGLGGYYTDRGYPDTFAPIFSGIQSVGSETATTLTLSWSAARDQFTPSSLIVYDIYQSTTPGGQNYTQPTYTTIPGVTSYVVGGLSVSTTYYFVVRARDKSYNRDTNTVELSGTTIPGEVSYIF